MTDGRGNRTEYRYNEHDQISEIITPKGHHAMRMNYDDRYRAIDQTVGESELYSFVYLIISYLTYPSGTT
ncbi:hypothetical protein [Candidatus Electrothrix sp.]|uniref:hypothetical protein n=1 Tax=Candidatus Electrothrix sp. TaxID=2170559 RepID=UPI004055BC0E